MISKSSHWWRQSTVYFDEMQIAWGFCTQRKKKKYLCIVLLLCMINGVPFISIYLYCMYQYEWEIVVCVSVCSIYVIISSIVGLCDYDYLSLCIVGLSERIHLVIFIQPQRDWKPSKNKHWLESVVVVIVIAGIKHIVTCPLNDDVKNDFSRFRLINQPF